MKEKISLKTRTLIVACFLLIIVMYGAYLRLYSIGYSSYWIDEGFTLMQVEGITLHGYPLLRSGIIEWKDPLIPFLVAPLAKLFSFELHGLMRLIPALFGIATIYVGYHFANSLFRSRSIALAFSLFLATGYWYIAWSQQVRGYSALILFVLLFFYFFVRYHHTEKKSFLIKAILCIFLAIIAKKFGIILALPLISYFIFTQKYRIAVPLIIGTILSGLFLYFFVHIPLELSGLNYIRLYLTGYLWSYFSLFLLLGLSGLVLIGFTRAKDSPIHLSILIFIFSAITFFSFFVIVGERRYLLLVTPFLYLYSAYILFWIADHFKRTDIVFGILVMSALVLSVTVHSGSILWPQKHYALEHYTPQPNYRDAFGALAQHAGTREKVVVSTLPWMDQIYLGQNDYYIPWSLTGREADSTLISSGQRDVQSGARKLYGKGNKTAVDKLYALQEDQDVYIVFDALSARRVGFDIWDEVTEIGELIYQDRVSDGVVVYYLQQDETVDNY